MKSMNSGMMIGADEIDVLDRVEGDAAEHARGGVAEAGSHPRVRRLMQAERENEDDELKNTT